jgi:hypothetical protein
MAGKFNVRGFPTIKMFPAGKKGVLTESAAEYDGGRTASDIVSWALGKMAENVPPPEIVEVRLFKNSFNFAKIIFLVNFGQDSEGRLRRETIVRHCCTASLARLSIKVPQ